MEVTGGHGGVGRLTQMTNRMGWSPCRKRRGGHRHTEGGPRGGGGERAEEDPALRASTTEGQPQETDTASQWRAGRGAHFLWVCTSHHLVSLPGPQAP